MVFPHCDEASNLRDLVTQWFKILLDQLQLVGSSIAVLEDHLKPSTCPHATLITSEPLEQWHTTIYFHQDRLDGNSLSL